MKAYKCDRCNKYFSENDLYEYIGNHGPILYVTTAPERQADRCDRTFDLCPKCIMALADWVRQKEEEK